MINPKHPFYSANDYYREKFGSKIIKIAIDGGFTCPNRDGKLSTKGCIFCSAKGSGDFAGSRVLSVTEQFEQMKEKMAKNGDMENTLFIFKPLQTLTEVLINCVNSILKLPIYQM